ncbi:carbohydrate ABC transporter permease [Metabacillus arenae]|uniref:Sugar ABC transporter permease n=1 Tax=Metabacillus arenae TaxID=2771434 RepID=A0A926S0Y7_9BACI|nr:sugar ABC transporter permease [Metabacillus arenae]MBD1380494.1 sugar ABC transporter permease [Metabacillus arenae]
MKNTEIIKEVNKQMKVSQRILPKKLMSFRSIEPYLYLIPAILSVAFWIYRPLLQAFELSFYNWNLIQTSPKIFVGLENFISIFRQPEMGKALVNTIIYIIGILPLSVLIPLMIAIMTDNIGKKAGNIYHALIFLPMVIAPVVIAIVWRWILHPTNGIGSVVLNTIFQLKEPIRFFSDERIAIWSIVFITGWKMIGFSTLIFYTALKGMNREYYEAAAVDGASRFQLIRHITMPLLSPYILLVTMISILFSSEWSFTYIDVLTEGGPFYSTTNIHYLLWIFGFQTFKVGWSSAASILLFCCFGVLAWLLIQLSNKLSFYDD